MAAPARFFHTQQVHFLRKGFTYSDDATTVTIGTIPAGALVLKPLSGVAVTTVFDGTAPQTVNFGNSVSAAIWGTALALSVTTFVPCDENANYLVSSDTICQAVITSSGASAGAGELIVAYIPDSDG